MKKLMLAVAGAVAMMSAAFADTTTPAWWVSPGLVGAKYTIPDTSGDGSFYQVSANGDYYAACDAMGGGSLELFSMSDLLAGDFSKRINAFSNAEACGVIAGYQTRGAAINAQAGRVLISSYEQKKKMFSLPIGSDAYVTSGEGQNVFTIENDKDITPNAFFFTPDGKYMYTSAMESSNDARNHVFKFAVGKLDESGVGLTFVDGCEYDFGARIRSGWMAKVNGKVLYYALLDGSTGIKVLDTESGEISSVVVPAPIASSYGSICISGTAANAPHLTLLPCNGSWSSDLYIYSLAQDGKSIDSQSDPIIIPIADLTSACTFSNYQNGNSIVVSDDETTAIVAMDKCACTLQTTPAFSVTSGETTTDYYDFATALAAMNDGDTLTFLKNQTLSARYDVEAANKAITIDLNGKTITPTATCGNGSAFNIVSGTVTIKNGAIDGSAITDIECDPITVRANAAAVLDGLNVTICSKNGACAYAFAPGARITVKSGTYVNNTTEDYQWQTGWKALTLNQANDTDQLVFVEGGTFKGMSPAAGDDSGNPSTFLADGYFVQSTEAGYVVAKKVAAIGDNFYTDVKSAFAAAENGDTVELLCDYTVDHDNNVLDGKGITFDLGGYTLTATNAAILVYMKGASSIVLTNGTFFVSNNYADDTSDEGIEHDGSAGSSDSHIVIAKSATIISHSSYAVYGFGATVDVYGTIECTRDSESCVWINKPNAVLNVYEGAVLKSWDYDAIRNRADKVVTAETAPAINIYGGTLDCGYITHSYMQGGATTNYTQFTIKGGTFKRGYFQSDTDNAWPNFVVPADSTAAFEVEPISRVKAALPENYVFAKKAGDSYWRVAAPFAVGAPAIIGNKATVTLDQTVVPYGGTLSGTIANVATGYNPYVFVDGKLVAVDENGVFTGTCTDSAAVAVAFVKDAAWYNDPFVKNDVDVGYTSSSRVGVPVLNGDGSHLLMANDWNNAQAAYNTIKFYLLNEVDFNGYIGSYLGTPINSVEILGGEKGQGVVDSKFESFGGYVECGDFILASPSQGAAHGGASVVMPLAGDWGGYTNGMTQTTECNPGDRYYASKFDINNGTMPKAKGANWPDGLQWFSCARASTDKKSVYFNMYARNEITKATVGTDADGKVTITKSGIFWRTNPDEATHAGNWAQGLALFNDGTKDIVLASLSDGRLVKLDETTLSGNTYTNCYSIEKSEPAYVQDCKMIELAATGFALGERGVMSVVGVAEGTPHLVCQFSDGNTKVYALTMAGDLVSATPIVDIAATAYGAPKCWNSLTTKDDELTAYAAYADAAKDSHLVTVTARPENVIVRGTFSTYEEAEEDVLVEYGDPCEVTYTAPEGKKIVGVTVNGVADTTFTADSYTFASAALTKNVYIQMTTEDLPAAKIGTTVYVTLAKAFEEAQEGDKIEMLRDVALAEKLIINTAATTFDLGGYTLSAATEESVSDGKLIDIAGGDMMITNGTINVGNNELRMSDGVEVTIAKDATIKSTYTWGIGVKAATLNVYGQVINTGSECQAIWPFSAGGVVNVYAGAYVCGKGNAIRCNPSGTAYININGGVIESNGGYNPIRAYKTGDAAVITIKDGTFKASGGDCAIQGMLQIEVDTVVVTPLDDTCKAKFQNDRCGWGGTKPLADYCADGYAPFKGEDGWYTIQKIGAKIGTAVYLTLNDALNAAKDGDEVTLCQNATLSGALTIGKAVGINLAGKTLTPDPTAAIGITITEDAAITNGTIASALTANVAGSVLVEIDDADVLLQDLAVDAAFYEYGIAACANRDTLADYYTSAPAMTVACTNVAVTGNGALIYAQCANVTLDENCSAIYNQGPLFSNASHRSAIYSAVNAIVTIAGGEYTHEKALLSGNLGAKIIANGGTFNGQVYSWMDSTAHDDLEQYDDYVAQFLLNGGTYTGAIAFFKDDDDGASRELDYFKKGADADVTALTLPADYKWDAEGVLVKDAGTVVAKIGDVEYTNLRDALVACGKTETVQIVADIDLNNAEWTPVDDAVGTVDGGIYDENGVLTGRHVIKNLKVTKDGDYAGMFGKKNVGISYSDPIDVKNIIFENVDISGQQYVGILAYQTGDNTNVLVRGTIKVSGTKYVGALVGQGYAEYFDCHIDGGNKSQSSVTQTGSSQVGAMVGFMCDGHKAVNCSAKNITVSGVTSVGGLAGRVHRSCMVLGCQVTNVDIVSGDTGLTKTGAIVGELYNIWNGDKSCLETPQFFANNTFSTVTINTTSTDLPKYGSCVTTGGNYCLVYTTSDNAVWDAAYKFSAGTFALHSSEANREYTLTALKNQVVDGYEVVAGEVEGTYVVQAKPAGYDVTFTFSDTVTAIAYAITGGESGSATSGTAITVPDGEKIIITPTAVESIKIPLFTSTPTEGTGLQTFSFTNTYDQAGAWTITVSEAAEDPSPVAEEAVKEATAGSLDGTTEEKVAAKEAIDAATTGDGAVAASDVAAWVSASTTTTVPSAAELAAASKEQIQLSVDFGTEALVDNAEDAIKIDELEATTTTAEDKTAFNLTFEFQDTKGDIVEATKAAKEKVAAIVKATSDLGDWTGDAKLTPEISADGTIVDGAIKFKIELPKTSTKAFMKIQK